MQLIILPECNIGDGRAWMSIVSPACMQLLELLDRWVLEAEVVLVAAPALGRVLSARKELTLMTLERLDVLGNLARGIKRQQQAEEAAQVHHSCRCPSRQADINLVHWGCGCTHPLWLPGEGVGPLHRIRNSFLMLCLRSATAT